VSKDLGDQRNGESVHEFSLREAISEIFRHRREDGYGERRGCRSVAEDRSNCGGDGYGGYAEMKETFRNWIE
jgi:hypothetical protein